MTTLQKLETVARMIRVDFRYDNYSSALSMYKIGKGDCLAGSSMFRSFCMDFGIVVDEIKEDGTGHFQSHFKIDGVKYIADTTPASTGYIVKA